MAILAQPANRIGLLIESVKTHGLLKDAANVRHPFTCDRAGFTLCQSPYKQSLPFRLSLDLQHSVRQR